MQTQFLQNQKILNKIRHKRIKSFHFSLPQKSNIISKLENISIKKINTEHNEQNQDQFQNYKLKKCWEKLQEAGTLSKKIKFVYREQQNLIQEQQRETNFMNFCKKTFQKQKITLQRLKTKYGKVMEIRRNHHLQQMQLKKQKIRSDQQIYKQKLKLKQSIKNYKQSLQSSRIKLKQEKIDIANRIRYSLQISKRKCYQKQAEQYDKKRRIYTIIKQDQQKVKGSMMQLLSEKKKTINQIKLNKLAVQLQSLKKQDISLNKLKQQSSEYEKKIKLVRKQAQSEIQTYKKKLYLQNHYAELKEEKNLATTITLFQNQASKH